MTSLRCCSADAHAQLAEREAAVASLEADKAAAQEAVTAAAQAQAEADAQKAQQVCKALRGACNFSRSTRPGALCYPAVFTHRACVDVILPLPASCTGC